MKRAYLFLPLCALLVGCRSSAFITALGEDRVVVRSHYPDETQVIAEANRGCGFHGRAAVPISRQCLDKSCSTQSFVFACTGPDSPSLDRTSPWLGISVDDIADHLYADPPGSSEVVVSRVFADGPAKKAGLRVGDIIESFNGVAVSHSLMLIGLKRDLRAGEPIPISIRRANKEMRLEVLPQG
ncbi:MAG: PDZ domain-containing protein [Bdellovibrio bacteriovorus]